MAQVPSFMTAGGEVAAFEVFEPDDQTLPFVFCSPHSGRDYPTELVEATRLQGEAVRRSEDLFVDRIFDFVPALGAPLLTARFPRAFLDVNREPYELDPRMFSEALPSYANAASVRVAGGLGTIPRIVAENEEIYRSPLGLEQGLRRIEDIYKPFHALLEGLLARTRERFGLAILVDCHSMPSSVRTMPGGRRPDIVIGDRYGTSASGRLVALAAARLTELGYEVTRNKPYAGGFITERYGRPAVGFHAIQIEINRALYADERHFRPHEGLGRVQADMRTFAVHFAAEVQAEYLTPGAAAAE